MDDRNSPEEGTAELSMDDAVSIMTPNSSDEEQSPPATETEEPKTEDEAEDETEEVEDEAEDDDEGDEEEVDASSETDDEAPNDQLELDLDTVIELDGQEVTLKELQDGNLRQSEFTRKSQILAEERRAFEAERQAIEEERMRYAQSLSQMQQTMEANAEQEPDWDALFEQDPLEYVRLNKQFQDRKEARQKLAAEQEALHQRQAAEMQQQQRQAIEVGKAELLEKIPEWRDPDVAATESKDITQFLLGRGYSPEAVANVSVTDILFAREAMTSLKATSKTEVAKKKVKAKPRVIKAQASKPKSEGRKAQRRKQMAKLERSGSIDDALPLLLNS